MWICLLLASLSLPVATVEERLATLETLPLPTAEILELRHDPTPIQKSADGKASKPLPPHTWFKLLLHPAPRSNIRVEICLPDPEKWNGRLLGLGNGGAAGHINSPTLAGYAAQGFATVTTDMGTAPNPDSGIHNPEVWKDFGFRATHLMTVVARQSIQAFYGRPPEYAYFVGGSTGGQQALQEAQRYPEDYDGIVGTVPAHCRTPLHAYFLWNHQILTACPFTPAQEAGVIAAAKEYLASRQVPVAAGKFIADPRASAEDIAGVIALAQQHDPTLTPEHAAALQKLFTGPRHAVTGERLFNGIPLGASLSAAHGHLYLWQWVFGRDKNLSELNFGADLDTYIAALAPYLNAENADLRPFAQRGGKLLLTTGTADSVVPPQATIDYYERVTEQCGGLPAVQAFCRLYVVPGMSHGPGPGLNNTPNLFDLIRAWRETGAAPGLLPGKRIIEGKTELEMPLFPYPAQARWDAATSKYVEEAGPRGGIERVAERFRPAAKE